MNDKPKLMTMTPRTMTRVLLCSMGVLAIGIGGMSGSPARAVTIKVDCDKGQSIQTRLDNNVQAGDTVEVSGSCSGNVVIRADNLRLRCVGGASLDSAAGATVIVRATDVRISGCTITGDSADGTGILVDRSSSAVLTDNAASGLRTGFVITQGSYGRLIGTAEFPDAPSQSSTGNATGVVISGGANADVIRNDISGNTGNGMSILRNSSADIVGNDINGNGERGVALLRSSSADFSNDVTFGNEANRISGNGGNGIGCFDNGAMRFGAAQDFTGGNGSSNVFTPPATSNGCSISGTP